MPGNSNSGLTHKQQYALKKAISQKRSRLSVSDTTVQTITGDVVDESAVSDYGNYVSQYGNAAGSFPGLVGGLISNFFSGFFDKAGSVELPPMTDVYEPQGGGGETPSRYDSGGQGNIPGGMPQNLVPGWAHQNALLEKQYLLDRILGGGSRKGGYNSGEFSIDKYWKEEPSLEEEDFQEEDILSNYDMDDLKRAYKNNDDLLGYFESERDPTEFGEEDYQPETDEDIHEMVEYAVGVATGESQDTSMS